MFSHLFLTYFTDIQIHISKFTKLLKYKRNTYNWFIQTTAFGKVQSILRFD
jgi:hypothetical protein